MGIKVGRSKDNELSHKYKDLVKDYKALSENVRNLNAMLEGYNDVIINLRNNNAILEGYSNLLINVRNNNSLLEQIETHSEMVNAKLSRIEKKHIAELMVDKEVPSDNCTKANIQNDQKLQVIEAENSYDCIDYFDFENHLRGSRQHVKETQKQYLRFFEGKKNVYDLGCGRGEFLELLKENNINAVGIDFYEEFVDFCNEKGLNAIKDDAIKALKKAENIDGIFAGQLIEHLNVAQLVALCEAAYKNMAEGAYMILETPNPTSLAIYTHAFYMDPSHMKPVHPLTLKYILEKAGFKKIEIIYTESSKLPISIPELKCEGVNNVMEFNKGIKDIVNTLYGSQDYAMIAQK